MNARLAIERIDDKAGVIGEGDAPARLCRCHRLDARISGEGFPGLLRLREAELAGSLRFDTVRREELAHFREFAGIVRRNDDGSGEAARHC
jgi:hypothetical protein